MRLTTFTRTTALLAVLALGVACSSDDDTPTEPALTAPSGVTVTTTLSSATITWQPVTGATSYSVQRATGTTGGTFASVSDQVTGTTLTDNGITAGTDYRYRVAAIRSGVFSSYSSESSPVRLTGLGTPAGLNVAATTGAATITWQAVTGATGYILQRASGTTGGTFVQVGNQLTATSFADSSLTAGTDYRYRVQALGNGQSSSFSTESSPVRLQTAGPKVAKISANITASRTLYADTTYVLSGYVKVQNGATLTVQPGTTIVGDSTVLGSSLWILRGAKIQAVGTAAAPIVFTSQRSAGSRKPGDWGGIIIIGNGIINRTGSTITTEGGAAGQAENYAGGTDNNDNSGTLRYVRIEFAGFDVSNGGGQELNSLSSYAVGRGTTYEYIESVSGLDDSFEWWGGAVDGRYLVSYESGDDHFDWTEGYVGATSS